MDPAMDLGDLEPVQQGRKKRAGGGAALPVARVRGPGGKFVKGGGRGGGGGGGGGRGGGVSKTARLKALRAARRETLDTLAAERLRSKLLLARIRELSPPKKALKRNYEFTSRG